MQAQFARTTERLHDFEVFSLRYLRVQGIPPGSTAVFSIRLIRDKLRRVPGAYSQLATILTGKLDVPPLRNLSSIGASAQLLLSSFPLTLPRFRLVQYSLDYTQSRMHCNPLHRIFVTSLVLLSVNAFPLRIFGRQSPHELTAGSSNDDIRCAEARDCAAAEFGIPSNSHYKCNRKGRCTYGSSSLLPSSPNITDIHT